MQLPCIYKRTYHRCMPHEWPSPLCRTNADILSGVRVWERLESCSSGSIFEEDQVAVQPYQEKHSQWDSIRLLVYFALIGSSNSASFMQSQSRKQSAKWTSFSMIGVVLSWWPPSTPLNSYLVVEYTAISIGTRLLQLWSARNISVYSIILLLLPYYFTFDPLHVHSGDPSDLEDSITMCHAFHSLTHSPPLSNRMMCLLFQQTTQVVSVRSNTTPYLSTVPDFHSPLQIHYTIVPET